MCMHVTVLCRHCIWFIVIYKQWSPWGDGGDLYRYCVCDCQNMMNQVIRHPRKSRRTLDIGKVSPAKAGGI